MSTHSVADSVAADAGPIDLRILREVALRCEDQVDALAERVVAQWRAHLPGYEMLRDDEHPAALSEAIRIFLRAAQGIPAQEDMRLLFRRRAAYRAEQGVPLTTLLRTYTIAVPAVFDGVRQEVRADEVAALAQLARLLFTMQDQAITEVARAYQEELAALGAVRRDRRRELVRDLVSGTIPGAATLEEFGLDAGAAVLAIRLGPLGAAANGNGNGTATGTGTSTSTSTGSIPQQPSATSPGEPAAAAPASQRSNSQPPHAPSLRSSPADALEPAFSPFEVAIRRRLLRLQRALDSHFGRPVPALLEQSGGHALVPGANPTVAAELSGRLAEVWGDEARIAVAVADRPEQIGPAAATATEVLRLASALGRPSGVYTLDDVLLEYHLTRQNESAQPLSALLDPLSTRPDLLHTVRVFLEEQYDRRRTASRLNLHPNTVDNRLARVTELTGLDPATPRGVALLMTALALRDLR